MRRLTIDKRIRYTVALAALAASLLVLFVPKEYILWSAAAIFAIAAAAASAFIKKRSIHSYNKRQVLLIVSVFAALYLTLYYLSGIKFGFVISTQGALSLNSFVKNIIPLTAIIVFSEIIRSLLLTEESRPIVFISYAIGVASAVVCAGGIPSFRSAYQLTDFLGITLFPALTANLLYTYLSKRYGIFPSLAYRLILTLYVFVIPIISDVPKILPAFILLVMPIIIQVFVNTLFEKKKRKASRRESKWGLVFSIIAGALMVGIIMLVTCQFRFGIIVIATESMTGEINKGDAVVFESYEYCDGINENDIIVFEENNRQVVHRVVEINTVNGQRQYITKGDANDGIDSGYRTDEHIVGVVRLKVLYIGYPSLWLREIFN